MLQAYLDEQRYRDPVDSETRKMSLMDFISRDSPVPPPKSCSSLELDVDTSSKPISFKEIQAEELGKKASEDRLKKDQNLEKFKELLTELKTKISEMDQFLDGPVLSAPVDEVNRVWKAFTTLFENTDKSLGLVRNKAYRQKFVETFELRASAFKLRIEEVILKKLADEEQQQLALREEREAEQRATEERRKKTRLTSYAG